MFSSVITRQLIALGLRSISKNALLNQFAIQWFITKNPKLRYALGQAVQRDISDEFYLQSLQYVIRAQRFILADFADTQFAATIGRLIANSIKNAECSALENDHFDHRGFSESFSWCVSFVTQSEDPPLDK